MNKKETFGISADALKIYTLVILAVSILGNGFILHNYQPFDIKAMLENANVMELMVEASRPDAYTVLSNVITLIGSLAAPVYAFLLIEGYLYTVSAKVHMGVWLFYSVCMEVPYGFYMNREPWCLESHNPMLAMMISLVMVFILNFVHQQINAKIPRVVAYVLVVSVATYFSIISRTNLGVYGNIGTYLVLVTAFMYLFYNKPVVWRVAVVILSLLLGFYLAPVSLVLLYFYDGTRKDIINKYVYYAAYPVLLIIGAFL